MFDVIPEGKVEFVGKFATHGGRLGVGLPIECAPIDLEFFRMLDRVVLGSILCVGGMDEADN